MEYCDRHMGHDTSVSKLYKVRSELNATPRNRSDIIQSDVKQVTNAVGERTQFTNSYIQYTSVSFSI